jgi:hypothetical protein
MSQWGAEGYAGRSARQILAHYPQTTIEAGQPRPVRVLPERAAIPCVGSMAPFVVLDARGHKLHLPARSVVVNRRFTPSSLAAAPLPAGAQPLQVDFAGYRGDVVVSGSRAGHGGQPAAGTCARGFVEVPKGWHEATYRAQAAAARTLATLKPGKDFDLFSDTSQVYGASAQSACRRISPSVRRRVRC